MKTCGIDLGTTNSCIFVVEDTGNRLIKDEYEHETFPSVVYMGRDGKHSVGYSARNRLGEFPGPIATIKRKMGSTETVLLGDAEKTPVEVSAMILAYLKELAEKAIGAEVDRAVVTVPAYFSHIQRQQTDEAGKLAGFREVVTLLEPVAAALAYSLSSEQDKLRVFVYDLGGGTFDATVLEKDRYGGITVLSFGGDPFLGGDDIDARLARLLIERLTDKGYSLDLDLDIPEDFSRFQRLKFFAELAKKELTDKDEFALVRQGLMQDKAGETIDLDLIVTRQELEDCAKDLIRRSIDESLATLAKKDIPLDSIDEIIMVGGMSRMPLAQQMLEEAFGRLPKVVDPDLIVARGAAMKAAQVFARQEVAESGLRLELRYDRRTDKPRARISGLFDRKLDGHTVYLMNESIELHQAVDDSDRFTFDNVSLVAETENVFTLSVEGSDEESIMEREIRIIHSSDANEIRVSPGSVVTKPISVWTIDGLEELFPENTALPHTVRHTFETGDQSGQIIAPIWEGNHEVARLEIADIPGDLKIGTPVIIEVSVQSDYHIEASANVPDIKRGVSIHFEIEAVDTSKITREYVLQQLEELDQQSQEAIKNCPSQEAIEIFRLRYGMVKDQISVELSEMEPKRAKLHEKLRELSALIESLPSKDSNIQLKPSFEGFSERLTEIITQAIEANHSRLPQIRPQVDALREQARTAWEAKDPIAWRKVNDQVEAIAGALSPELKPEEKLAGLTYILVYKQIPEIQAVANGRFATELASIKAEAEMIFFKAQTGIIGIDEGVNNLISLYQGRVMPLRSSLGLASSEMPDISAVPETGGGTGVIRKVK